METDKGDKGILGQRGGRNETFNRDRKKDEGAGGKERDSGSRASTAGTVLSSCVL